jgi:hypothetical protein
LGHAGEPGSGQGDVHTKGGRCTVSHDVAERHHPGGVGGGGVRVLEVAARGRVEAVDAGSLGLRRVVGGEEPLVRVVGRDTEVVGVHLLSRADEVRGRACRSGAGLLDHVAGDREPLTPGGGADVDHLLLGPAQLGRKVVQVGGHLLGRLR